jgi:hypothetical protein
MDAEGFCETTRACRGDRDRTRIPLPLDPSQIQATRRERGTQSTGDVRKPLAPIQARPAKHALACHRFGAKVAQEHAALLRHLAAIMRQRDMPGRGQRIGQRDT